MKGNVVKKYVQLNTYAIIVFSEIFFIVSMLTEFRISAIILLVVDKNNRYNIIY